MKFYVARTAPMAEFKCVSRLKRAGAVAFCPIETKWVKRRASKELLNYPILVRYAIVGCENIQQLWGGLREDPDVYPRIMQGVLGVNRLKPLCLSEDEVSYLASLSENPVPYVQSVNPHRAALVVREGQTARVFDGPFAGRSGPVSKIVGKRATVIMELFNSMQEVQIPLDVLEASA